MGMPPSERLCWASSRAIWKPGSDVDIFYFKFTSDVCIYERYQARRLINLLALLIRIVFRYMCQNVYIWVCIISLVVALREGVGASMNNDKVDIDNSLI